MAMNGDSSSSDGSNQSCTSSLSLPMKFTGPEEGTPWIGHVLQQALIYQKAVLGTLDDTMKLAMSQRSEILSSFSVYLRKTMDLLAYAKSEFVVHEDKLFGCVKEGVKASACHPFVSGGVASCLGLVFLKRPRRFLYYNTLRYFVGEELLLSKADAKVKEMRKLFSSLKAENEKLEMQTLSAEADFRRGRMKLRQAGKQIQGVIQAAYKIEAQARGLKDVTWQLRLPPRESSKFKSQISELRREAKLERTAMIKQVANINERGIAV